MSTENNKKDTVLEAQRLQTALFEMRDSLVKLSIELKDYLFEVHQANQSLEAQVKDRLKNKPVDEGSDK